MGGLLMAKPVKRPRVSRKPTKPKVWSEPELKARLMAMREARRKACEAEINEVLRKHNCNMSASIEVPSMRPTIVVVLND